MEAPISTEIELKLAASAADLPALTQALAAMAAGAEATRAELVSTYYDTPDRALQRAGLGLRVRRSGQGFVQTVKSSRGVDGNRLARGEWEDSVAGPTPDGTAPHSGPTLPAGIADRLRPLFVTKIARTAIALAPDPATRIEAVVDDGTIASLAGDAVDRVSEVELELASGDSAALYDIALRLIEVAPLRIEMRSKSQRGYRLVEGRAAPPEAVHAAMPGLDRTMTAGFALRRIGRCCLDHLLRNEAAALAGRPDGIHQMRIAVRRLRTALAAFGPLLPAGADFDDELKWLADALGTARNLDVFGTALLQPACDAAPYRSELKYLADATDRCRRAAYDQAASAILSTRYTVAMLRLLHWFEGRGWHDPPAERDHALLPPIAEIARQLLDRRRQAVHERGKGFAGQGSRKRHQLRIALKELRYTSELFAGLFDRGDVEIFEKSLKRLQDELGYVNDVRMSRAIVAELRAGAASKHPIAAAGKHVLAWHRRKLAKAEPKLRRHLRRLDRAPPFWQREMAEA